MTREELKEWMPIITAFNEGKKIQRRDHRGRWWNVMALDFSIPPSQHRIAPEPRVRWVNVYANGSESVHKSGINADKAACMSASPRIECIHFREVIDE